MNIKYNIVIAVIGLFLLGSCYDDKGNYDYREINDIVITLDMEEISFVLGDTVKIKPKLLFSMGKESSELVYKWTFNGQEISNESDLNWIANIIASNSLVLEIFDKSTGITYSGWVIIYVGSAYVNDGWLILSEKDNNSVLTYLRRRVVNDTLKCVTTRDIYNFINKESLGSQPLSMSVHYVNQFDSEDKISWIWVAQKGGQGCVDLSGSSYRREGSLNEMFLSKSYPDGFNPQSVVDLKFLTIAVGEDGSMYTRVKESDLLFNTGYFLDRPLMFEGDKVDGTQLVMAPFAEQGGILLYDKNSSRYLHLCDAKDEYQSWPSGNIVTNAVYSGKILSPTVDNRLYDKIPGFAHLDKMSDYTVHYTGAYINGSYRTGYMSVISKGGVFYLQNFRVNRFDIYEPDMISATPLSQEIMPVSGIVNGASKNVFKLCRYQTEAPYMFISSNDGLYLYYLKTNTLFKYDQFDAPIASMDVENYNCKYLSVGLENGDFHVLSLNMDVVEEVMKTGDSKKKRLYEEKGFGKIIQVLDKGNVGSWVWN